MKITAHVLLKNEENFVWYSIMSIINYVDKILIYDTGSDDKTVDIIKKINDPKIILREIKSNKFDEEKLRQQMLDETTTDWFIVLDADEIWWEDSIKLVTDTINKEGEKLDSIVVPTVNMVGDVFHYQEKEAGRYNLAGRIGHYATRAINRRIPNIHGVGEHGVFMWADITNTKIEDLNQNKIKFLDAPYLHATHLKRSSSDHNVFKRTMKLKYEIGIETPKDYFYPEIFFKNKPDFVKSPWETPNLIYKIIAMIETPLKKFRRRYLMKGVSHGY